MKTAPIFCILLAVVGCEIREDLAFVPNQKPKDTIKIEGKRRESMARSTNNSVPRYRVLRIGKQD